MKHNRHYRTLGLGFGRLSGGFSMSDNGSYVSLELISF